MISIWRRPNDTNLNYMTSSIHITGQNTEQFSIQVLETETAKIQALNLITQELLGDYPVISAFGFDKTSEAALQYWIEMHLSQNIAFGCYTSEGDLVAVDCLYVRNIRDTFLNWSENSGKAFRSFIKYIKIIETRVRYLSKRKVCNYLTSVGVFTTPAHRDIGIQKQMIRMRKLIARSLGIEVVGSAFIGSNMIDAAKANNYKDLDTFNTPQDMKKLDLDFNFGKVFPIKIMGVRYKYLPEKLVVDEEESGNTVTLID